MLQAGREVGLLFIVLFGVAAYLSVRTMQRGAKYPLRRLSALEAVKEAVGRATELGRPVFFSTGFGDIVGPDGMQVIAGLDVLSFTSKMCAEYNARVISTVCRENVLPVTEEVVRSAYRMAGRPDAYQPEMVQFLSPAQMAYCAGSIAIMRREKVAASILIGPFFGEALIMAEAAAEIGAIGIAGTSRLSQLPLFIAACDYVLIGEEMFAGSAYLSGDAVSLGNIASQDLAKVVAVVLLLAGSLLQTFTIGILRDIIRLRR